MTRRSVLRAAPAFVAAYGSRGSAEPRFETIEIKGMKFGNPPDGLHVGDKLSFVNHDMFRHTATARDGSFDLDLPPGREDVVVLEKAGETEIYCRFHPGMVVKLAVAA